MTKTINERAKACGAKAMTQQEYKILSRIKGPLSGFQMGYIFGCLDQLEIDRKGFREWLVNNVDSIYWEIEAPSSKAIGDALYAKFMATQVKDELEENENNQSTC